MKRILRRLDMEFAASCWERALGLMFRKSGEMLFVFKKDVRYFGMDAFYEIFYWMCFFLMGKEKSWK
ncbi:MAG TPA: DUF192 domain-containing protein [Candidatus Aenigmarchaeota archaeon]|nr:DUF192 domain-containing protein [Candidatus Aenigmarchaeota archaeon]